MTTRARAETCTVRDPFRYRQFEVTVNSASVLVFNGIDVTSEEVFERRQEAFRKGWSERRKDKHEASPSAFVGDWGHEVVWEGCDVIAVIIPETVGPAMPANQVKLIVYRFDRTWAGQPGRVWDGRPEVDKDIEDEGDDAD